LTNRQETDITTIIQRRRQHPRRTGRDQSERVVAINRNRWVAIVGMRTQEGRASRQDAQAEIEVATEALDKAHVFGSGQAAKLARVALEAGDVL
jgi:hypothetical protein